jgi:hypothetical protein
LILPTTSSDVIGLRHERLEGGLHASKASLSSDLRQRRIGDRAVFRARRRCHDRRNVYLFGDIPCVNSDDIINGEVKNPDLAGGAVATGKVLDNSLQGIDIQDATLTGADIGNNTLTSAKLADGAVIPAKVGTIPAARAKKSSNQSVPTNAATVLAFEAEDFDTAALHDQTANNTRLTAPISGVYQVSAGVTWAPNAAGKRQLQLRVNGTCCSAVIDGPPSAGNTRQVASDILKLSAGDFVEAAVFHSGAGGPLDAVAGAQTFLAMAWVGPA